MGVLEWRKLGRVFDCDPSCLPPGCVGWAQSPQALVFPTFIRVFFSTRSQEGEGLYVSHVASVDLDLALTRVLDASRRAVLGPASLGSFDEHGVFPMSVVRHGRDVWGYTTGWSRRVSVPVETAIGLAVSHDDGRTFTRAGPGPVLAASLHEPFLVADGFVRVFGGLHHMWYIAGREWRRYVAGGPPERIYKIAHATSCDGLHWVDEGGVGLVPDKLGPDECQALPCVVRLGDLYHMFFCYREPSRFRTDPACSYRLGHAVSDDLSTWVRSEADVLPPGGPGEWDEEMQCYPHVFSCGRRAYLLYNGNEFGRHGFGAAVLES